MQLGLIAGNGRFPFLMLEAACTQKHKVTIVAAKEEASPDLSKAAAKYHADIYWVSIGQLGKCIDIFKQASVTKVVMAGQIKHTRIFSGDIVPDLTFLSVLSKLATRNTDGLIGAITKVFNEHGLEVIDSTALMTPMLAPKGVLTERAPTEIEKKEFSFGYQMAEAIASLDIGQTVAVKERAVVAVEAMEGTDAVITRAGKLAGPGVCIVKVAKPSQDMRFDVPVIGLGTVKSMIQSGAVALSVDAGKTLIMDKPETLGAASKAGIAVFGRSSK